MTNKVSIKGVDFRLINGANGDNQPTPNTKRCKDCNKPLKQTLVNRNPEAEVCWVCHQLSRGKTESSKKIRINGVVTGIKIIDLKEKQRINRKNYKWKR